MTTKNLLNTRFRGTDIDSPKLDPASALWIRDTSLADMIGIWDFPRAVAYILLGEEPSKTEYATCKDLLRASLLSFCSPDIDWNVLHGLIRSGASVNSTVAAVLQFSLSRSQEIEVAPADMGRFSADQIEGISIIGRLPALYAAAIASCNHRFDDFISRAREAFSLPGYSDIFFSLIAGESGIASDNASLFEAILVSWHGGFGFFTPTVLAPRVCIGTGIKMVEAVAVGLMASGPKHVGAAEKAVSLFQQIAEEVRQGDASGSNAVTVAIENALDGPEQIIYGFGHPLFEADPRPPVIRKIAPDIPSRNLYWKIYDEVCEQVFARKGLHPNIDSVTAAALGSWGVKDAAWGSALGLCSRSAAIVAHLIERKQRPPFGVNSKTARIYLASAPIGWL